MKFKFRAVFASILFTAVCGASGIAHSQELNFSDFLGWDVRYLSGGNISSCAAVRQELINQHPALYGTGEFEARTSGTPYELTIKGQQLREGDVYYTTDPDGQGIRVFNVSPDRSYFDWEEVTNPNHPKLGVAIVWVDAGNGITTNFATITDAVDGRRVSDRNSTQKINAVGFCAYGDTPAAEGGPECNKEGLALGVWCQAAGHQFTQGVDIHAGSDESCTCQVTNPYMVLRQCNDADSFAPAGLTGDNPGDGICDPNYESCCTITPFCDTYYTDPAQCDEEVVSGPATAANWSRGRSPRNGIMFYQPAGGTITSGAVAACGDTIDNDFDGLPDTLDPDCVDGFDNDESQ